MTDKEKINENQSEDAENTTEEVKAEASKNDKKEEKKASKELAAAKEALAQTEKKLDEMTDKYLRTVAEYENFRKRSRAEKEATYSDAYADALLQLLPVIDNLQLAARYSEGDKVLEGVKMILAQMDASLEKMGVEEIETKVFDPNLHNAVMHVDDEAYGEGEIVDVFQKGYRKGDKIIRYAMVKVAN